MPHHLQYSISREEHGNEDALCINSTSPAADEGEQPAFMPLAPVAGTDGASYESFSAYIASMPAKNCHVVPDERVQRFLRILNGEDAPDDSLAQLKRDGEKLFNTKELGAKAPDGTRFSFGHWELHQCVDMCSGGSIQRPKHENTYKGGKQAMMSSSECEAVIRKVHVLGGHKGQERTWKDIAHVYDGVHIAVPARLRFAVRPALAAVQGQFFTYTFISSCGIPSA